MNRARSAGIAKTILFPAFCLTTGAAIPPRSEAAPPSLDAKAIGDASGASTTTTPDGGVKIGWSRTDVAVTVDGMTLPPAAGLGSWAAFAAMANGVMVMGDTVVFEDEVDAAMDAAFAHGLSATALHNHFFHDTPKVYFMHIGGEGKPEALAAGVKAVWAAIRAVRSAHPQPAASFGGETPTAGHIDAGAVGKIIGQTGPWAIGALDVETGRSSFSAPTNLFAGHLTYDVDEHLRIGTLVTRGNPMGKNNNQFTGFDAVWQTATFRGDKNLTLAGWTARSDDDMPTGQHSGWGLYAQYPNDRWSWNASVNVFGDALNPALGFLPRSGTRQYDVYTDYRPRPTSDAFRWARQFFYQLEVQQVDDLHGSMQTRRIFTAPFNVDTESGEHFEFDWIPDYEALTKPFAIADGVALPTGRYHFDRYRFEAQSSDARPWRIGNVVEIGDFYTGRLTQTRPFVNWTTLEGKLRFEFSNETDFGYLPQGNFIQRLYQLKASYSFSPDLNVSSFAQYDSSVGHIGINTRLHWILAPGRDFFLVFNHGMEASVADPAARLARVSNAVVAKLRWDFRP